MHRSQVPLDAVRDDIQENIKRDGFDGNYNTTRKRFGRGLTMGEAIDTQRHSKYKNVYDRLHPTVTKQAFRGRLRMGREVDKALTTPIKGH